MKNLLVLTMFAFSYLNSYAANFTKDDKVTFECVPFKSDVVNIAATHQVLVKANGKKICESRYYGLTEERCNSEMAEILKKYETSTITSIIPTGIEDGGCMFNFGRSTDDLMDQVLELKGKLRMTSDRLYNCESKERLQVDQSSRKNTKYMGNGYPNMQTPISPAGMR